LLYPFLYSIIKISPVSGLISLLRTNKPLQTGLPQRAAG